MVSCVLIEWMGNTYEVFLDRLAYGGDALGRLPDGRVVFIPYTIPGELVRVKLLDDKPRHARGELVEVLKPAPARVHPRCPHFGTCGGCQYQHMSYAYQLGAKGEILKEQLERIGGLKDIPKIELIAAPESWYYRNHIQFHLTGEGKLGFQKARFNQPFAIRECHLPEQGINQLWPQIELEPLRGLERVSLRQGAEADLMIILESSSPQALDFNIQDLAVSIVEVDSVGSLVLTGSDYILMDILGKRFTVSATSFFQVNTCQAEAMVKYMLADLPLSGDMTVLDVYSGVGLFSAFLAPKVKRLVGIEISPQACEDFTTNLDEYENVELYEAEAEHVLNNVIFNPQVIVMDPPRAGLGRKTVEGVLSQRARTLAYVSCDPATLARDGKQLEAGGYTLTKIALIDMFPQTYHIESITFWSKKI